MKVILKLTLLASLLIATAGMPVEGFAQQARSISGLVVDENDDPIIGASVAIPGTAFGTATNVDGKFQLSVPADRSTLQVSYLGYQAQTVVIGSQSNLIIKLTPTDQSLDELIVIGYGSQKKRDLTGAIASVKSEDIALAPTANTMEALQGRVAGLDITRSDGRVGSNMTIRLRGTRSLNASNTPHYIIDGIPGDINYVNPNDIASVDILKDAASTAIYGSAGANGVVIVTTKQAERGKAHVDFTASYGINTNPIYPKAMSGEKWLTYLQEGYTASYPTAPVPDFNNPTELQVLLQDAGVPSAGVGYINNNQWINWVDKIMQTGLQQDYAFSVRAGGENVRGNFSVGLNDNKGVFLNDQATRYTMRAAVEAQVKPWLKGGIQTSLLFSDADSRSSQLAYAYTRFYPLGMTHDENGNINEFYIEGLESSVNPLVDDIPGRYRSNTKRVNVTANPYIEISPIKGLTYRSMLGTTLAFSRSGQFSSNKTFSALTMSAGQLNRASYNTTFDYRYVWQNTVNYNKTIAADHSLGIMVGTEWANRQNESGNASASDFLFDEHLWYRLQAGNQIPGVSTTYSMRRMMSLIGRVTYGYKGKYLLNLTIRTDGASQLANHWDSFPGASAAWRISDEDFMAPTKTWLSNLKLRVEYGVAGNSDISPYSSRTEITPSTGNDASLNLGGGSLALYIPTQTVGNADLGWEKTYGANIGLDVGLFKNRIDLALEWYDTDTRDILYTRNLPSSGGSYRPNESYRMTSNLARISNRGVEITLNTRNIDKKNFKWNSTLTFAANKDELKEINLGSSTTVEDYISLGLYVGRSRRVVYGLKKLGLWQLGEEDDAAVFGLLPGDSKVQSNLTKVSDGVWVDYTKETPVEYTKDGPYYSIGPADRIFFGQSLPKWTGSLQNVFLYKGFDLTVFMIARWGHLGSPGNYFGYGQINMPETYSRWTPENPTNDYPRYYRQRTTRYSSPTTGTGSNVDASYLKIKNVTLGYELPKKLCSKTGLSKVRVYGTVYNMFILTKNHLWKDVDPESPSGDWPLYKQMVFGLNVSF